MSAPAAKNRPRAAARAMTRATWNGAVIAESDRTVVVEENHYFPAQAVAKQHLRPSATHTLCPWKGEASYYEVIVGDEVNPDAAWYYPAPKPAAREIAGHIAFWKGVRVESLGPTRADRA